MTMQHTDAVARLCMWPVGPENTTMHQGIAQSSCGAHREVNLDGLWNSEAPLLAKSLVDGGISGMQDIIEAHLSAIRLLIGPMCFGISDRASSDRNSWLRGIFLHCCSHIPLIIDIMSGTSEIFHDFLSRLGESSGYKYRVYPNRFGKNPTTVQNEST